MTQPSKAALQAAYDALYNNVVSLRLELSQCDDANTPLSIEEIDIRLFRLVGKVWAEQKQALNIPASE